MRKAALISALVLAVAGAATIAFAQVDGNGQGAPAGEPETHASECAEETKQGGAFGACVSERASAFGRCVAEAARDGEVPPTEACAELKPDRGNGNGPNGDNGNGGNGNGDNGNGNGDAVAPAAANNPTDGVTRPPEQHGRDFGHQVAGNAGGNPGGNAEGRNPTQGVESSPEDGRDFGQEVAGNARGDRGGPPEGTPAP